MTRQPKKLLDQVRDAIRLKLYAYITENTYVYFGRHKPPTARGAPDSAR